MKTELTKWWPDKEERERLEIEGFIASQQVLPQRRDFEVATRGEKPDYILRDKNTKTLYGVELTSVYIDDRSVPDQHMKIHDGPVDIPFDREQLEKYKDRILSAVSDKIEKAKSGYDTSNPLILSVYVNEYCSIDLDEKEMDAWVHSNTEIFDNMHPFGEIIFWTSSIGGVLSVTPE